MPNHTQPELPKVTEATLIEFLGDRAPSQDELWAELGRQVQGELAVAATIRAAQLEDAGFSPRDAALYMAAWTVAALSRQVRRDNTVADLSAMLENCWTDEPLTANDARLSVGG